MALRMDAGTSAVTVGGEPLQSIQVYAVDDPPEPDGGCRIVGPVFGFGPEGALFRPYLEIALQYDPASCPDEVPLGDLVIGRFDASTGEWTRLPSLVETVNHRVSAQVTGFSLFAVVAEVGPATGWWLIGGIIGGVTVVVLGALQVIRRRGYRPAAEAVPVGSEENP
jgi:hypothetical protein